MLRSVGCGALRRRRAFCRLVCIPVELFICTRRGYGAASPESLLTFADEGLIIGETTEVLREASMSLSTGALPLGLRVSLNKNKVHAFGILDATVEPISVDGNHADVSLSWQRDSLVCKPDVDRRLKEIILMGDIARWMICGAADICVKG